MPAGAASGADFRGLSPGPRSPRRPPASSEVDHGAVQPLEILFDGIDTVPVTPVFVNGVARPFVTMRRVRKLGEAIGGHVAGLDGERVPGIGSGGLSHDPPVPQWATADDAARAMLLDGPARDARQQRVIDTAKAFAAGTAPIQDLNPDGDRALRATFASGDLTPADAMTPDRTAEDAGNSAHEVRTWLAAHGAAGPYEVTHSFYRPIKEYTAGFGVMTARSVAG
ncbi:hypothetical protein ACF06N_07285 [Streptomyces albidoflavus]